MRLNTYSYLLAIFPLHALTLPTQPYTIREIYQFPNTTAPKAVENLAIRPNGHLFFSVSSAGEVYDLDTSSAIPTPVLVHRFANANATTGIAEFAPDVFAVAVGKYSSDGKGVKGSFSVWLVNLNFESPHVSKIDMPKAGGLNGMTTINGEYSDCLFIADSNLGVIWRLNTTSGSYEKALENSHFLPDGLKVPWGVNGIHVLDQHLYFTDTANSTYGRVPVMPQGNIVGHKLSIIEHVSGADDFALNTDGSAFVAVHPNSVIEIESSGNLRNITKNSNNNISAVQPTSVRFGKGKSKHLLCVVTAGDVEEGGINNGQILEIDGSGLRLE